MPAYARLLDWALGAVVMPWGLLAGEDSAVPGCVLWTSSDHRKRQSNQWTRDERVLDDLTLAGMRNRTVVDDASCVGELESWSTR